MENIIIMTGLPGSGKSLVAEEIINKEKNAVIVSRDAIRTMICNGYGKYKYTAIIESLVLSMAVSCMESALERGYLVIIDETNITKQKRLYWKNMASMIGERKGFDVKFMGIWVNTPIDICIARRTVDTKGNDADWNAIINNMMGVWEDPSEDEFGTFKVIEYKK